MTLHKPAAMRKVVQAAKNAVAIIEEVDFRCMGADGPVTPTRREITDEEFRLIYWPLRRTLDALERAVP